MATSTTTTITCTTTLTTTTTHNTMPPIAPKDRSTPGRNRRNRLLFTTGDPRITGDRAEDEPILTFTEKNKTKQRRRF